jgi:transposase
MMIIGCDFHPSWQQVSFGHGDWGNGRAKLVQRAMAKRNVVLSETGGAGADRHGSHGQQPVVCELAEDLGHEVWIGDAAQIRASYVRKQKTTSAMRGTF